MVSGRASPEEILEVQSRVTRAIVRFTKGLALADVSGRPWNDEREERPCRKPSAAAALALGGAQRATATLRPPPAGFDLSLPGFLVMFVVLVIIAGGGTILIQDRLDGQFAATRSRRP